MLNNRDARLDNPTSKLAAITFDDGYKSVLTNAAPLLKRHDLPFTVFVNPSLVGSKGYLTWQELALLQKQGAIIANHTLSHPHLIRQNSGESEADWLLRVDSEVRRAEEIILDKLGVSVKQLAYPYGEYNSAIETLLAKAGYSAFAQHSGAVGIYSQLQAIPRFPFGGRYAENDSFIDKFNSLPMPLLGVVASSEFGSPLIDPLLPAGVEKPTLTLTLSQPLQLTCFATGQGAIPVAYPAQTQAVAQAGSTLPVGRSRYNCTAASTVPGRFYWYSHPFFRLRADGSWYNEY
ncbi:polysaccharide deacetylase family protein [Halioxenophilus sp. WMMB6]|uniref:polysaccharide deacetylase family protein n=1 Tax=Halioxenophilus sp. WMMB6 TaxID=3073815 RepID=UPI00295EDED9|nr:polysaccharide deacetylase family protein [Halioxenophilus sp. WMMB6]